MRLILASAISALFVVPALTPDAGFLARAHAHGGSYRGPAGEVPPNSRQPTDPPPPADPPPPGTPGGEGDAPDGPITGDGGSDGPSTPDDSSGGPGTTGGDPPGIGPSGTGGPATSPNGRRRAGAKGPGFEDWTFWWNYNKDGILQLQSAVLRAQRGARSGGILHRGGGSSGGGNVVVATDAMIKNRIIPVLREMLAEDGLNFDIQSAAALGLAKMSDTTITETLKRMARNERAGKSGKRGGYHRVVRESAALAFGLLQSPDQDTQQFLIEALQNDEEQGSFVRPFAAVSLGLLGVEGDTDGAGREALLQVIANDKESTENRASALTALGLMGDPAQVGPLLHVVERQRLDRKGAAELSDLEVAYAVQALGRIGQVGLPGADGDSRVADALLKCVEIKRKNKTHRHVRHSAVIALGRLAPTADEALQKRMFDALKKSAGSKDVTAAERNFALIAIGRVAGTKGVSPDIRENTITTLRYALRKATPKNIVRPYAALGLGLIGRAMRQEGLPTRADDINEPIRDAFAESRNNRARGAYAVASGLVGDKLAVRGLIEVLEEDSTDGKLRGYCAVALGLMGAEDAKAAIGQALANENDRDLRLQAATAAGLIGDQGVIESLVDILKSRDESQYVLGSVALALGRIGDHRSVEPLINIARDPDDTYPDLTQALATVALGQIGDRRELPTLSRVAEDVNYRALVPAMIELLSIL